MKQVYKISGHMKKNHFFIAILACILTGFTGCQSDLLDTIPSDSVSSENIWTNSNLATQAVTGAYAIFLEEFKTPDGSNPFWDVRSSILDFDSNWLGDTPHLTGRATPSSGDFSRFWKRFYEAIHRANDVIANIGKVPDMTDEKKAQYIAECKFIRAFFYFRLNVLWRGVPVYLEPIEIEDCIEPRSSEEVVWQLVINDLTDAINEPNLPDRYSAASSDWGRATKAAAYALRGKAYLFMENYASAQSDLEKVTHMGFSLFDDYKQLFKEENERCDEMIFTIQYIEQSGYGNGISRAYGNRGSAGAGWNNYIPNPTFIESYECADGKPFDWEDYLPGYYSMDSRARSVYFLRDNLTESEITTMMEYGADMSHYLPNGNEARIRTAYDNRDPRLHMNIITPYSTYLGGLTGEEINYTLRWPYRGSDSAEPFDLRTDTNSKFYYLMRKYVFEGREHIYQLYSPIDVPLIRYADVLLLLAEALNEQDKTSEAIEYVNMVRQRAGQALLNSNPYTQVTGQENMRERIRNERYWELAGEGHLYFDELRWKTWKDKKFFEGNGMTEIWGTTTYTYSWLGEQNWIWPIPAAEMEMNSNLTQNPGWNN